jgi:hypothetical protein
VRTITAAALSAVVYAKRDVVTSFRGMLRGALLSSLESEHDFTKVRNVIAIHVRFGDVHSYLYDIDAFLKKSEILSKNLNHINSYQDIKILESSDILSAYDWGQCAMSSDQIRLIVKHALATYPDLKIEIITHKSHKVLDEIAKDFPLVKILANESEMQSIYRLATAKHLYLANSYMGFLGGLLSNESSTVYYPPNLMYAAFGLGSKYDTSNWIPMLTQELMSRQQMRSPSILKRSSSHRRQSRSSLERHAMYSSGKHEIAPYPEAGLHHPLAVG